MWTVKAPLRRGFPLLWKARDYGATTWSPPCPEQLSWRFHWWRHSHSVPVRWRRGVARVALAVEQVARAAQPEPQATQAAREAVRAATALLNRPAAKAVRLAILLLNRPAVRAKIASIPQGPELGLVPRPGACADATAWLDVSVRACRRCVKPVVQAAGTKPLRPVLSAWRLPFRFRLMRAPGPGLSTSSGPFAV